MFVFQDGGCTCPGDVSKAFGAGADFVMLGGMFAGHDESGGELIVKNGRKFKQFYGMASGTAMAKYSENKDLLDYRFKILFSAPCSGLIILILMILQGF